MFAGLEDALERERIASFVLFNDLRPHAGEDRLPREPHVQTGEVVVLVERAHQLALHDRVIPALDHVLLTRPEQLHRCARHLLGDVDRLMHVVLERAAPAEAAAEVDLVHFAFVGRQTGCGQHRRERRFAVLRRDPDLALVGRAARGGIHRLQCGVVQIRVGVDGLDPFRRAGDGRLGIAVLVADKGLFGVEPGLENLGDRGARDLGIRAFVPDDRQRIERGLGLPPCLRHDGHAGVANLHHLFDAGHALDLGGIEARHLAAEDGAFLDCGIEHSG